MSSYFPFSELGKLNNIDFSEQFEIDTNVAVSANITQQKNINESENIPEESIDIKDLSQPVTNLSQADNFSKLVFLFLLTILIGLIIKYNY